MSKNFKNLSRRSLQQLDYFFDKISTKVKNITGIGTGDPIIIDAYWGYGTMTYLYLKGRILEDEKIIVSENDSTIRNLINAYKRFESDEIAGAKVRVFYLGQTFEAVTDKEGYFTIDQHFKNTTVQPDSFVVEAEVQLYEVPQQEEILINEIAYIQVPDERAEYGIISDIDDTVLVSDVTSPLMIKTAYHTLFSSPNARMSFSGTPELYHALRRGSDGEKQNPTFYVSNSPYNLFDFLVTFLETAQLPLGPIHLRDFGLFKPERPEGYRGDKHENIIHIMQAYPDLPFILIGDSGEKDADIYQAIAKEFPERVKAIYVRDVQSKKRTKRIQVLIDSFEVENIPMILANDATTIENHAIENGFILRQALQEEEKEKENEEV